MLTNPRESFEDRPHLETELNMVDDFLNNSESDYFPHDFIQTYFFFKKNKTRI